MLAMAEYAYNNSKDASIKIARLHSNRAFEPRKNCPTKVQFKNLASQHYRHYMTNVQATLSMRLDESIGAMRKYSDMKM